MEEEIRISEWIVEALKAHVAKLISRRARVVRKSTGGAASLHLLPIAHLERRRGGTHAVPSKPARSLLGHFVPMIYTV